jgi:hypothetical protein
MRDNSTGIGMAMTTCSDEWIYILSKIGLTKNKIADQKKEGKLNVAHKNIFCAAPSIPQRGKLLAFCCLKLFEQMKHFEQIEHF